MFFANVISCHQQTQGNNTFFSGQEQRKNPEIFGQILAIFQRKNYEISPKFAVTHQPRNILGW